MSSIRMLLVITLGLLASACGPRFVKGTEIDYTSERQTIANLVDRYREAVATRNTAELRKMVSRNYFENASTTSDPRDDYGYEGLDRLFEAMKSDVKEVRYTLELKAIEVYEKTATADFDYEAQYLYAAGPDERWANRIDHNRLTFRKEGDKWMIIGGL